MAKQRKNITKKSKEKKDKKSVVEHIVSHKELITIILGICASLYPIVNAKSVAKFKVRMKQLTCRSWGVSNSYKVQKLNELIRGWINYFRIGSMKTLCEKMDSNIRYRIRMCIWKHWKTPQNRAKKLMKLGIEKNTAYKTAYAGQRIAYVCNKGAVNVVISNKRLASFGLISMLDYYTERCVIC